MTVDLEIRVRAIKYSDKSVLPLEDEKINEGLFEDSPLLTFGYMAFKGLEEQKILGYCFVKNAMSHPELTSLYVLKSHRDQGIATRLINEIVNNRSTNHHLYAATSNLASLKAFLKAGFQVFDVTKDGYIQLIKVLPYGK